MKLRYRETTPADPEQLQGALQLTEPEVVHLTPSPVSWDLRNSDAEATVALLHVLRALDPDTPVLAELFLPTSVERLPRARPQARRRPRNGPERALRR